jgi:uncharacterized protein (DUF2267 family)
MSNPTKRLRYNWRYTLLGVNTDEQAENMVRAILAELRQALPADAALTALGMAQRVRMDINNLNDQIRSLKDELVRRDLVLIARQNEYATAIEAGKVLEHQINGAHGEVQQLRVTEQHNAMALNETKKARALAEAQREVLRDIISIALKGKGNA